jgi:hypothetical protein
MDNQSLLPQTPGMFPGSSRSSSPIMIILLLVLAIGTLIFGVATVNYYGQYQTATKTLASKTEAAAQAAEANQKKVDAVAYSAQNESPFRAFVAPDAYGAFVINFPKDWSSSVDEEQNATQVSLILNPDFIQSTNQVVAKVAARVMLIDTPSTQYMSNFSGQIQEGMVKQSNITVSGQPGFNLTGTFNDNKTIREVVVPVRDKVLVFTTEDNQYATEFDEILAQCKINP